MNFYAYTDKALKYLRRYYIRQFNTAKMQIRSDNLNIIGVSQQLYNNLARETELVFRKIAKHKYREICDEDFLVGMWLSGFLEESNPLTGYVWRNDIDRKRQYFVESLLAEMPESGKLSATKGNGKLSVADIDKAAKKALRYWYQAQKQYADLVTDAAAMQAYTDTNIEFVMWKTAEDEKVCYTCQSRDGKIYPLDYAPRKPHYNCRCYFVKVVK